MAMLIPNEGEVVSLTEFLDGGTTRENFTLILFKSNTTPAETDTVATYTPVTSADWPGYADVTLTRTISGTTWQTVASGAPTNAWSAEASVAESTYNPSTPQSYTNNGSGTVIVYGYILKGATSTKLRAVETFSSGGVASPVTLLVSGQMQITPRYGTS